MNSNIDEFANYNKSLDSPADIFIELTPQDVDLVNMPRALFIPEDGSLTVTDKNNNQVTFNVSIGQILPIRPKQINTGTTLTKVIALY